MTQWQTYSNKFDALSQREKLMAFVAGLAVVLLIGFTYGVEPLVKDIADKQKTLKALEMSESSLSRQEKVYQDALNKDPNAEPNEQLTQLRKRMRNLDEQFSDELSELVPPSAMPALIAEMLGLADNISLSMMEALAPENVFSKNETMQDVALYQHGIRLEFSGSFDNVLRFLTALENTDWQVYWHLMTFNVDTYPTSTFTIEFYTLSTEKVFIRV